ncbi:MAG: ATP-binding protein, partial [Bacteroidetes bacterium]|nr:ATP-binding protein [Bacteroidota bacterium]
MQKLPISKSVFKEIRTEDCCYVDKTFFVRQLLDDHSKYWFLSRPRRFGKSLFLDTLRAAFAGERDLFKGLYLETNWDWNIKYPVVKISFGRGTVTSVEMLNNAIYFSLTNNADFYDIELEADSIPERFEELIQKLDKKFDLGVVVLVDEYDKPLLDNLTKDVAEEMREGLSSFYSVLKDADRYIKFVFLTGVSKFSKTSIFSKLNNLTDISLKPKYGDICGYRQEDLESVFIDYLNDVDLSKVKEWYNGYNFLGSNVYNPYDVLLFLSDKRYQCYWFETGTPTFLLELMKERKFFVPDLHNIELSDSQMGEFDINNIELEVLLYQTGYLTIKNTTEIASRTFYSLSVPNKEVSIGLNDYLLRMFFASGTNASTTSKLSQKIFKALNSNQPELLESAFISFFSGIPYKWYVKNNIAKYEGYYCSVFYSFFAALGLTINPEDITNKGRIDFTIVMEKSIFIFEIKM